MSAISSYSCSRPSAAVMAFFSRFALMAGLVISGAAFTVQAAQPQMPPAQVQTASVESQQMAPVSWVPGTVISRNDAQIATEISGRLTWVAEVGQRVKAGEAVGRIDDQRLQIQLQTEQANIKRLEVAYQYATKQVERLQALSASNSTARNQLDEAVSRRDMAEQELAQAKLALKRTQLDVDRTQIRAPFDGQIAERHLQTGEYVNVGQALVRLVDTSNIEIRTRAPLALAQYLDENSEVVVANGDQVVASPVRSLINVGDELSRTFELRLGLPAENWLIGTAVRVALPSHQPREVVAVPRDALVLRRDGTFVYRVNDGTAEKVIVKPGMGQGTYVEVEGELSPGEEVIIRGAERLQDGQAVMVAGSKPS